MLQVHAVAATDASAPALQAPLFEGYFVDKQIFFSAGFSLQPVASKKAPIHVGACQLCEQSGLTSWDHFRIDSDPDPEKT